MNDPDHGTRVSYRRGIFWPARSATSPSQPLSLVRDFFPQASPRRWLKPQPGLLPQILFMSLLSGFDIGPGEGTEMLSEALCSPVLSSGRLPSVALTETRGDCAESDRPGLSSSEETRQAQLLSQWIPGVFQRHRPPPDQWEGTRRRRGLLPPLDTWRFAFGRADSAPPTAASPPFPSPAEMGVGLVLLLAGSLGGKCWLVVPRSPGGVCRALAGLDNRAIGGGSGRGGLSLRAAAARDGEEKAVGAGPPRGWLSCWQTGRLPSPRLCRRKEGRGVPLLLAPG